MHYKAENQNESEKNYFFLIAGLASIPLLIHLYTNIFAGYGIFRDELYYIACSNRPALGYVDQPPLSIYILAVSRLLFGDSLFAIRLLPAVNSALTVIVTCLMALKLGGRKMSVVISGFAVIFAPVYIGISSIYSMNSFDVLFWAMAFYLIILIIENNKLTYWILLGIVMGLGSLNKVGFLWLEFGFFIGILISDKRKLLLTYRPYLCALTALLIFSPFIIWNFQNDFAHLEFIRNATSGKYSNLNSGDFIIGQITNMNPFSVLIWLSGLYYFLFNKTGRKFMIPGIIYIVTFTILIINGHSKAGYLAPAYTVLFAGGGVFIEKLTEHRLKFIRYVILLPLILLGILITPLALPVLPVEAYIKYAAKMGFAPTSSESKELSELPQFYADMFGWEKLAKDVSEIYMQIPEDQRVNVLVYCENYGEAGAIEFFSNKFPLPKAISNHNNYWIWGYGDLKNPVVIIIGGKAEDHLRNFGEVVRAGTHSAEYSMPYENNLPIFIARNMKSNINELWNKIKNFE